MFAHRAALGGRGVARPARPAVIFGAAVEQRRAASGATIDAVALVVGIFAGERPLGAAFAQHMMRHRVERLAGGLFGFGVGHGEAPSDGRSKAIMLIPISARRRAIARGARSARLD